MNVFCVAQEGQAREAETASHTRLLGKEWTLVWHPKRPSLGEKRNSMNKLLLCVCCSGAECKCRHLRPKPQDAQSHALLSP